MLELSKIQLTQKDIQEIEFYDKYFRNINLETFAKKHEDEIINNANPPIPFLPVSPKIRGFNDLKRVSINKTVRTDKKNNRLSKLQDLKYPPKEVEKKLYYNRASYKYQSMFYGGFGQFQALFENPPKFGDLYTISTWKTKRKHRFMLCSNIS